MNDSSTLIRGGLVVTMEADGPDPFVGDVLVRDGAIAEVAPSVEPAPGARVIDASRRRYFASQ